MAKLARYSERYEWENDKEEKAAYLLAEPTIMHLKNLLYYEKQRKENLTLDPAEPLKFVQAEAEARGAIGAYQYLLDKHDELITGLAVDQ